MGHLNNDVIRLIRSIVIKNKIHRCNKSYHERYEISAIGNDETYYIKRCYGYKAFNFRDFSDGYDYYIYIIGHFNPRAKLPKKY